jgi:hypothetical protein
MEGGGAEGAAGRPALGRQGLLPQHLETGRRHQPQQLPAPQPQPAPSPARGPPQCGWASAPTHSESRPRGGPRDEVAGAGAGAVKGGEGAQESGRAASGGGVGGGR